MKIIGIILVVLGIAAIFAAPEIMNSSEVITMRAAALGVIVLGAILAALGFAKSANKK